MEKENVLFISDIDRTLIFPKRFARDRDVCIEWTQDGKELNYINPDNLNTLVRLSKRIKVILVTIRTKEQYERIRWPIGLELHSVLLCFGNDVYFSQELEQRYSSANGNYIHVTISRKKNSDETMYWHKADDGAKPTKNGTSSGKSNSSTSKKNSGKQ